MYKGYCFSNNKTLHNFPNRRMAVEEANKQANQDQTTITIWSYRSGKPVLKVQPTNQK